MNIKVLKNKNLLLVILGQLVSGFGTMMQSFALSLYVLRQTGSAVLFSSVLVVSVIPRIVITPLAGVITDRFSRKKMIVIMDFASSLTVGIFCAIYLIQGELNMLSIYVLTLLLSSINSFFNPSMSAIIPDIVKKENLADANSVRALPESIISLLSPLAAGVLFGVFGLLPIMIVNSISFFASAISEIFIRIKKESIMHESEKEPYMVSMKKGLSFIKTLPEIILMIGVSVIANFALSPIFSVALPIVLLQDFGVSEQLYGVFNSLTTVGMLLGPIFAAGIIKKYHYSKLVWVILAFDGVMSLLIAVFAIKGLFGTVMINFIVMIILINILVITIMWVNLALSTAMQLLVPKNMLGRVSSVLGTFSMIAMPLGTALMGSLLEISKSYIIMGAYSILLVAVGFAARYGFDSLKKKGKMDITLGIKSAEKEVA